MVSKARDDLPEPDTPVITVNWLCGSDSEISLRLWTRAPRIRMYSCKLNFSIAVRAKRRGVRRGGSGRCAFLDEQSQFLIKPMESIAYWRYWWRGLRGPELLAVFVTDERQPGSGASAWGSRLDGGDALLQCVQPLVGVVIRDLCMSRMYSNARLQAVSRAAISCGCTAWLRSLSNPDPLDFPPRSRHRCVCRKGRWFSGSSARPRVARPRYALRWSGNRNLRTVTVLRRLHRRRLRNAGARAMRRSILTPAGRRG